LTKTAIFRIVNENFGKQFSGIGSIKKSEERRQKSEERRQKSEENEALSVESGDLSRQTGILNQWQDHRKGCRDGPLGRLI
jgi:hypothetical protein